MEARTIFRGFNSLYMLSILLIASKASVQEYSEEGDVVTRSQFPQSFIFGVSTSAYQVEGAILEDGKSLSNWDAFVHIKGKVNDGETGDIADDHYHRYLEDIEIIQSLGVDAYRFSISWTRILPSGRFGEINPAGIMFYNNIIDNLLLKGIKPFVMIHHFDLPEELQQRYGGWLSPFIQEDFAYFAEICFKNFGDRVKHWITMNEPNIESEFGYLEGEFPPARCSPPFGNCSAGNSDIEPLIATHNMLLAHAKAVKLYRHSFQSEQGGIIGMLVHAYMYEPLTNNEHDKEAASRALAYNVGWILDPLVFGDYPPEMRHYLGNELPTFTPEETELIKDSLDFVGVNHYGTHYVKDCLQGPPTSVATSSPSPMLHSHDSRCSKAADSAIRGFLELTPLRDGVLIGEPTGKDCFFVVPRGMEGIVEYAKKRYNKPIFILENGYSFPPETDDLENDIKRIDYHQEYLAFLARAIRNGADVRGYFIWSLMDNFEWAEGYSQKFGLYSINPATLDRVPRASAKWYKDFLSGKIRSKEGPKTEVSFAEKNGLLLDAKGGRAEMWI